MADRIPQHFVDDLIARTDIVDVIGGYVPLKRAGREYTARCPFHEEKTPSFTVSPEKQFYHCFGCAAHGTAIGFLMDYAHMSFREALQELAGRAGIEMPAIDGKAPQVQDNAGLYEVLVEAATYFRRQLREHPQASRAVAYLKGRGLSGQIAAEFGLGYAPPGWDNLLRLGNGPARIDALSRAGLIVANEAGKRYDRFRDRIMFPILDRRGRTVGFGGRVLDSGTPKYLNSPETPVFHKGREVYGLFQARHQRTNLARILVVEGYMDVVALAQFGIRNAVATLGTAITADHLNQLFSTVSQLVFCFDGDNAGRRAAWRALEQSLPLMRDGRQAGFLFLPEGEDPDSLIRKLGAEAFTARVAQATPLSSFLFDQLLAEIDMGSLDGQARLVERSKPLLGKLPHGPFRQLMVDRLAELTRMDSENLTTLLGSKKSSTESIRQEFKPKYQSPSLVRRTVTLLLHDPALAQSVDDFKGLETLCLPGARVLSELLELLRTNPHLNMAGVLEHFRGTDTAEQLGKLAVLEDPRSYGADPRREFQDAIARLQTRLREQRFEELQRKARTSSLSQAEKHEYAALIQRPGSGCQAGV